MSGVPTPVDTSGATAGAAPTAKSTKKSTTKTSKKKTAIKATGAGTQAKVKKPARKKKPAPKVNNAASTQSVLHDARAAAADLAQLRANAAARKADPLWYRIEDVVPAVLEAEHDFSTKLAFGKKSTATTALSSSSSSIVPSMQEQCQILERALSHNGISRSDVTPQAMTCLLEYARRYTTELIRDATDYADMVNRSDITRADLMLAAEMRQDNPVTVNAQLPMLNALAQQLNGKPLPPIPANCYSGILLPPPEHQLTARTFDVISGAVTAMRTRNKYPAPPSAAAGTALSTGKTASESMNSGSSSQPSYGATRGRQISVKLKGETGAEMTGGAAASGASTNKMSDQ
ncbi:hypothetical protein ACA910_019436 [Epithemia clementina (nom. ined.)]